MCLFSECIFTPSLSFNYNAGMSEMTITSDGSYYYSCDGGSNSSRINKYDLSGNFISSYYTTVDMRGFSYNQNDNLFYASLFGGDIIQFDNNSFNSYTTLHYNIMQYNNGVAAFSKDGSKFYDFFEGVLEIHDLYTGTVLDTKVGLLYGSGWADRGSVAVDSNYIFTWDHINDLIFAYNHSGTLVRTLNIRDSLNGLLGAQNGYSLSNTNNLLFVETNYSWFAFDYSLCLEVQNGCTDPSAFNFDSLSINDDGSCLYCDLINNFTNIYPSDSVSCDGISVASASSTYPIASYSWTNSQGNIISTNNFSYNLCNDVYIIDIIDSIGCIITDTLLFGSIYGCTDTNSINYFWGATIDDGSCIQFVYGCTDSLALNYDSLANVDNGNCIYPIYGCIDSLALNYNSFSNTDDGSCIYASGCTDSSAYNYDSLAINDDGSCLYCDLSNIMIISQNTSGNCDGLIIANAFSSNIPISYLWSNGDTQNNILALCSGIYTIIITDDVGCEIRDTIYLGLSAGCTDSLALNYDSLAIFDDGSCLYCINGCTDSLSLNYDSLATCDDGSCIILTYGCTDSTALNYFPGANFDDGSCTYSSNCTSPKPDGLYAYDVIDTRAKIGWNNMNSSDCMVWKYFVRYREVGTNGWTTKSAGVGNGLCNFGLNTVDKQLLNLTASTTYEFKMKAFYCGGTSSNYSPAVQFTTSDVCPDMTNLSVQTFNSNQSKAKFTWDTTGTYIFARILLRVDTAGATWLTAGGFGVYYPTLFVNKFGLQSGESYRAQGRTFCDQNITAYRSPSWTSPIFWTQPGSIRLQGGTSISDLDVYPNPSRDVFNISFNSDEIQDLNIRILSIVGAEVYSQDKKQFVGEYTNQISLNNYGKGIYFLEIETNNGIVNKKLILQ